MSKGKGLYGAMKKRADDSELAGEADPMGFRTDLRAVLSDIFPHENEITDNERLEWMIKNFTYTLDIGTFVFVRGCKLKLFNTPREAIDAAMRESK